MCKPCVKWTCLLKISNKAFNYYNSNVNSCAVSGKHLKLSHSQRMMNNVFSWSVKQD